MALEFNVVQAAVDAIKEHDSTATIYTEPQVQNVKYPCYFVSITSVSRRPAINHRWHVTYGLTVRRYAAQHGETPYLVARTEADKLPFMLRKLTNGDFSCIAQDPLAKVEDGDAVYTASYRIRLREQEPETMETMEVN